MTPSAEQPVRLAYRDRRFVREPAVIAIVVLTIFAAGLAIGIDRGLTAASREEVRP